MATLNFGLSGAQTAFTEYWQAVTAADERVARLTDASANSIEGWRFEPVVSALQALPIVRLLETIAPAHERSKQK